jgi:hypothetical protein
MDYNLRLWRRSRTRLNSLVGTILLSGCNLRELAI